jgi:hypothetical protein
MRAIGFFDNGAGLNPDNMKDDQAPTQARQLNMEEKRRLEKVLFADIDQAVLDYKSHRTSTRNEVIEGVTKQKSVRSLYDWPVPGSVDTRLS